MRGRAGDWLVTDATGGARTVLDASFRASHRHVNGTIWERVAIVSARPAEPGQTLATPEGRTTSVAGDWHVRDADGAEWFVPDEHFRRSYLRQEGLDE